MERVTPEPIEWAWHEYIDDSSLRNSATSAPSGSKHGHPSMMMALTSVAVIALVKPIMLTRLSGSLLFNCLKALGVYRITVQYGSGHLSRPQTGESIPVRAAAGDSSQSATGLGQKINIVIDVRQARQSRKGYPWIGISSNAVTSSQADMLGSQSKPCMERRGGVDENNQYGQTQEAA